MQILGAFEEECVCHSNSLNVDLQQLKLTAKRPTVITLCSAQVSALEETLEGELL